jgi:hypothetical protein
MPPAVGGALAPTVGARGVVTAGLFAGMPGAVGLPALACGTGGALGRCGLG